MMCRSTSLLSLILFGAEACVHPRPTAGRFFYEVSCEARLDRFDTVIQQKTSTYELAKRTGNIPLIPEMSGPLEVCLANRTVFDAEASVFYTLVPSQARMRDDGTMNYEVLAFSIPGIALVKHMAAGENLERPLYLELSPQGDLRMIRTQTLRTTEDLSTFGPDHQDLSNTIVEMSGGHALLRVVGINGEPTIAVANEASKTLVRLRGAPRTTERNVHLTPGGTHVLVEEAIAIGSKVSKTGRLWLYDADTGLIVNSFSDPHIEKLYFRSISPNGRVLYDLLDAYWFLDLHRTFRAEVVTQSPDGDFPQPFLFFSDK
jgi:hypothetical protein